MKYMQSAESPDEVYPKEDKLIAFCKKNKKIFLYGAGSYGTICCNILQKHGIKIEGFITTWGSQKKYHGISVYKADDKLPQLDENSGIILSLKEIFQSDVLLNIKKYKNIKVFLLKNKDFYELGLSLLKGAVEYFKITFPVDQITYPIKWKQILVVRLDAIGDLIWTTAFFRELKKNFSDSKITLVVRTANYSLIENCPYVDKIILYDCPLTAESYSVEMNKRAKIFAETYLKEEFDVVFLPRPIPRSLGDAIENILLAVYSGARIRIARADYIKDEEKKFFGILKDIFSVVKKHTDADHEVCRILDLLKLCGGIIYNTKMELWPSQNDKMFAQKILKKELSPGTHIYVAVGVVSNDENRTWDSCKYSEIIRRFRGWCGDRVKFVLLGGSNAKIAGEKIMNNLQNININLIGQTNISQAVAIISSCDIYIGANTGLLHIAAACDKPILEISAHLPDGLDTDVIAPVRTGAWGVNSKVLQPIQGLDDCTGFCKKPYAHCINQISADDAIVVLSDMIKNL